MDSLVLDSKKNIDFKTLQPNDTVTSIHMSNCAITDLSDFPIYPNTQTLDLSDNKITGGLERLAQLKNLTKLSLANNKISEQSAVAALKTLPIRMLDLEKNPVQSTEHYKENTWKLFTALQALDQQDKDGNEVEWEEDNDDDDEEDDNDNDEEENEEREEPAAKKQKIMDDNPGTIGLLGTGGVEEEDDGPDFDPEEEEEHEDDDVDEEDEAGAGGGGGDGSEP